MVLTDIIWTQLPDIEIFSVDTGRLHEETYSLLDRVQRRYGKRIRVYYPRRASTSRASSPSTASTVSTRASMSA